ncbi:MAG: hypothetical protein IKE49_00470 [Firmicutes bacterium]|nr:hypothetical protein [Bacillota bacterium]
MKRLMNDCRGSASVFLVSILGTMVMLVVAFIYATADSAVRSYSDSLLNMSSRAVLGEFDLDLKKDYEIFAFYGHKGQIEDKIEKYVRYSAADNKYVRIGTISAYPGEYSLLDCNVFEKEITDHMKYAAAKGIIEKLTGRDDPSHETIVKKEDRVLRNRSVTDSLPSRVYGFGQTDFTDRLDMIAENIGSITDIIKNGMDTALTNEYILAYFKDLLDDRPEHETFFRNEVEYIIEGSLSDETNRKQVSHIIVTARTTADAISILKDEKMRGEVTALAQLLSPGPGGLILEAAIIAAWSYAEAKNDMALLEHGKKVPVLKDHRTWAVDLESAWKGTASGYIDTGYSKGQDYEDYLRFILSFTERKVKLARIMDLIQINMKGNHNRDFLIREYNCGFRLEAEINGNRFSYDHVY